MEVSHLLLKQGANVNSQDEEGFSPLHINIAELPTLLELIPPPSPFGELCWLVKGVSLGGPSFSRLGEHTLHTAGHCSPAIVTYSYLPGASTAPTHHHCLWANPGLYTLVIHPHYSTPPAFSSWSMSHVIGVSPIPTPLFLCPPFLQ